MRRRWRRFVKEDIPGMHIDRSQYSPVRCQTSDPMFFLRVRATCLGIHRKLNSTISVSSSHRKQTLNLCYFREGLPLCRKSSAGRRDVGYLIKPSDDGEACWRIPCANLRCLKQRQPLPPSKMRLGDRWHNVEILGGKAVRCMQPDSPVVSQPCPSPMRPARLRAYGSFDYVSSGVMMQQEL